MVASSPVCPHGPFPRVLADLSLCGLPESLLPDYHDVGIDEFVLSGYPHLEEAWWMGEGVLPILQRRGLWEPPGTPAPDRGRTAAFAPLSGR